MVSFLLLFFNELILAPIVSCWQEAVGHRASCITIKNGIIVFDLIQFSLAGFLMIYCPAF